jgi:hypothetical protein
MAMTSKPSMCGICGRSRHFGEPPFAQIVESMQRGAAQMRVVYYACASCAAQRARELARLRDRVSGVEAATPSAAANG